MTVVLSSLAVVEAVLEAANVPATAAVRVAVCRDVSRRNGARKRSSGSGGEWPCW